jgi:hypothetical protein
MMTLTKVMERLARDCDQAVVFHFFVVFCRFECSLKRSGYLKQTRAGRGAEPDWKDYATTLRGRFAGVRRSAFKEACEFLLDDPPQRQIVVGVGKMGWARVISKAGDSHEERVLELVKVVRNNLFHGGKYPLPAGAIADTSRNRRLLKACITVLEECLRLSPGLWEAFEQVA